MTKINNISGGQCQSYHTDKRKETGKHEGRDTGKSEGIPEM